MKRQYYVLRGDPSDLAIFDQMDKTFEQIRRQHGRRFAYGYHQQGGAGLVRHVYQDQGENGSVSLVNDFHVPVTYLQIEAKTGEEAQQLGQWLGECLPIVSRAELQQDAQQGMETNPNLLIRLALGSGQEGTPETEAILQRGLNSADDLVRFRAAQAMGLTGWPGFLAELTERSKGDSSPEVREMARYALAACERKTPADAE